jgi:hypothetical protein
MCKLTPSCGDLLQDWLRYDEDPKLSFFGTHFGGTGDPDRQRVDRSFFYLLRGYVELVENITSERTERL